MTVQARPPSDATPDDELPLGERPTPLPGAISLPTSRAPIDGDAAVTVRGVTKRFEDREVVRDLSFDVPRGVIFGVIGPSGSGKTTTLRMMLGILRPTDGELRVLGREPLRFRRRDRERIGYLPQLFALFPELSVLENINFAASVYGMGWFRRGRKVREALDFVELWDARNKTANQLSGGMLRRLSLAATLVHNPHLIFLDEPTAGIDPVLRAKFWEHFRQLRDEGRTLIVTTQYVTESEYCDQIAVLKGGRLVAHGSPEEVRERAMGGEVVVVSGPDLGRRATTALRAVPGVRNIRHLPDETLEVVLAEAGTTVPQLVEALRAANVEVDSVSEQHPSFDDVFVRLMEEAGREEDEDAALVS